MLKENDFHKVVLLSYKNYKVTKSKGYFSGIQEILSGVCISK